MSAIAKNPMTEMMSALLRMYGLMGKYRVRYFLR